MLPAALFLDMVLCRCVVAQSGRAVVGHAAVHAGCCSMG